MKGDDLMTSLGVVFSFGDGFIRYPISRPRTTFHDAAYCKQSKLFFFFFFCCCC